MSLTQNRKKQMISATQIRKALRLCVRDPKEKNTEYHVLARDLSSIAHIHRAGQLITFYVEGVKGPECLLDAVWHLACGIAKHEGIQTAQQETTRSSATKLHNENVKDPRMDRD